MGIDNTILKDANENQYSLRAKDISGAGDGSLRRTLLFASLYPLDYAPGGSFQLTSRSGVMSAGLLANSPIYSFRWTSASLLAIIKRVRISAWSLSTGFSAGVAEFDMHVARSWTVADSAGVTDTISGDNGKLRTLMGSTSIAEIRHSDTTLLTAGTRTLDTQPVDSLIVDVSASTNKMFASRQSVFEKLQGEHPLVLAQNEGFVIRATVPATGTWSFAISPEWDEVPQF